MTRQAIGIVVGVVIGIIVGAAFDPASARAFDEYSDGREGMPDDRSREGRPATSLCRRVDARDTPSEASMPSSDVMQQELADLEQKLASARQAADAPGASERDKADLKLLEQEYLAARRRALRAPGSSTEGPQPTGTKQKVDKKLDEALQASFPGSDPVSFAEPAPVKEKDRSLPEVKLADQQAPQKAAAARKTT
jgi:hypothetical protein